MRKIIILVLLVFTPVAFANNLVAHWKMNETYWDGTADEVVDSSSQGNHGVQAGDANTTAAGKINRCGTFDGDDYVDIPNQDLTANWSISVWVYSENSGGSAGRMILGNNGDSDNWLYLQHGLRANFKNAAGSSFSWTSDTDFYQTWRHIVLVATDTTVELFLDSVSQGSQTITPTLKLYTIGSGYSSDSFALIGKLDVIMVFDKQLSHNEIRRLYNSGVGTEIPAEMDSTIRPRRYDNSLLPWRARYEF